MIVARTDCDTTRIGTSVRIDGDSFAVADEFVYIGSLLVTDNNTIHEIRRMVSSVDFKELAFEADLSPQQMYHAQNATTTGSPSWA